MGTGNRNLKAVLFANTDWYLYNFRLDYAKFLKAEGWEVIFLSPDGEHVKKLEAAGFRHIRLDFSRKGISPLQESRTIRRIEAIYQQEKPDLVQQFTVKCVIYGSIAAKKSGIEHIVNNITGLGYLFLSDSLIAHFLRVIVKRLYQFALTDTQVIFENPDDRSLFISMNLVNPEQTNIVLGTGIDTDVFQPVPPPDSIPLTVLPARMLWDKGIGEFVTAATNIRTKGVQARFALVGKMDEGNPTSIPYDQLTKWQKEGFVEWWGWQDDITAVFSMCDIVCLPSYREGLPKVLIEAAACSRPIITTDVPGCHEVVADGVNGLLVPVKNSEALETALMKLIQDQPLRKKMGAAGRCRAIEIFSTTQIDQETYAVYQKALAD